MNYEQLKKELFWEIRSLYYDFGINPDHIDLKRLIKKSYSLGYADTERENGF